MDLFYNMFRCTLSCLLKLCVFSPQLPEEARELEKELRQITKEKNEAVRSQDFEKVLSCLSSYSIISGSGGFLLIPTCAV